MWLILSLAAVLMFTAQNLLMRVLAVKSDHPRTFSFIFNSWGVIFALIFFVIERPSLIDFTEISWTQWLLIGGVALGYGLYEQTHFLVRKQLDASTTTILFQLTPVIGFMGALIFLHESLWRCRCAGNFL